MTHQESVDNSKKFLTELFFPSFCLGCNKEGTFLCQDCRSLLEILEYNYCLCSQNPLLVSTSKSTGKCNRCQDKRLSGLYFALPYKEKALTRKLIHQFKYEPHLKCLAKTLASIIIEHLVLAKKNTNDIWENSVLIPVPMDKKKLRERGYNQSEELAKELSVVLKVPVLTNCLIKIKHTAPQMELSKQERENNLKDAFDIKNSTIDGSMVLKGKKVFLVDDVYTSGCTMEECTKKLRQAGAKQVWGICIARESW